MSDYNSTATTTLYVNGKPAEQELQRLKKRAEDLEDALLQAWKSGDTAAQKSLKKAISETKRQIRTIQSEMVNVEQTLKRIDKATPNELRRALRQLKSNLDNIERGSRAWDEHQRKIKAVKEELAKINNESKAVHGNLWDRFAKKMFDWGAAIQTVMATVTGITMTARKAVQAYADMEQEMANVRKYTGMAAEQVERLNDDFKKMDTRTSREGLNQLAQEAGRLGMQSQEDVLGFVRAADKINVALDELGDGATLTLSKLTDIFGDRERLGVEQSLLSVGSVINELSQNCTASAPYLAEFASRMGGVGAQAGMTIQQIMAFGAVLDSNDQKVEASSTALSQVLVRLYQDPAKYAKVAGLDIKQFSDLLKQDANAALIQLLDSLQKVGGMDVLSPMFKDMGENGSRAIQALSTLAAHIDEVKSQQQVANEAFEEAISIDKEFNVQNNTVQAGLEKAKKNFNEMAVALGERLAPVMRYAITSSSALMRVVATVVDFLVKYKGTLTTLTLAIVGYNVAVKLSNAANFTLLRTYTLKMTLLRGQILLYKAVAVVMVETKAAALALRTAYFYLTGNIVKMKYALSELQLLMMKSNPWGLAAAAVAALIGLIVKLIPKQNEFTKSMKETIATANGMNTEFQKEQHELDVLWGKLKAARKGTDEYKSVKDAILKQYGAYLSGLIDENGEITNLAAAYDRLTLSIRRSARERGIAAAREKAEESYYAETEKNLNRLQEALEKSGVNAVQASEIVAKVSQFIVSGTPIDKKTIAMLGFANGSGSTWNSIKAIFGGGEIKGIINDLVDNRKTFQSSSRTFDAMQDAAHPLRNVATDRLMRQINALDKKIEENNKRLGKGESQLDIVTVVYKAGEKLGKEKWLKQSDAIKLRDQLRDELAYRTGSSGKSGQSGETTTGNGYTGVVNTSGGGRSERPGRSGHEDKFAAENDWREREIALNKIAWRQGEKNYEEYQNRLLEIAVLYEEKRLEHTDLTENERLNIQALKLDAERKQVEQWHEFTLEDEDRYYKTRVMELQGMYAQGGIEAEAYNGKLKEYELEHLRMVEQITKNRAEARIREWEEAVKSSAELMKEYQGNVDLLNRPVVDAYELTKKGWSGNPKEPGTGEVATVYSSQYGIEDSEGKVREILVTPILPDGSVLSEKELEDYINNKLQGASDILAADEKRIVIAVDVDPDGSAGQRLHELQEYYYAPQPGPESIDEAFYEQYLKAHEEYQKKLIQDQEEKQKQYQQNLQRHAEKMKEVWNQYFVTEKEKRASEYEAAKSLVDQAYQEEIAKEGYTAEEKLEIERRYQAALRELKKKFLDENQGDKKLEDWAGEALDKIFGEGTWDEYGQVVMSMYNSIASAFDSLNKMAEAENQIRISRLEKYYEREISMAEGNAYKVQQLERRKERQIAKIKADSAKKQYAQQVMAAIAGTATAAINAYASAAKEHWLLGAVAAAMAVAAGSIQIAAIRKQQQASLAQGYAEGGFTPKGRPDEPVGVVHAGEWVASQRLLQNPQARAAIETLDYAQRNNAYGVIEQADVTRQLSAPTVIAGAASDGAMMNAIVTVAAVLGRYSDTMQKLGDRLNEPFVTINTITGDAGQKKAQDDYISLMNNTLPKNKRK